MFSYTDTYSIQLLSINAILLSCKNFNALLIIIVSFVSVLIPIYIFPCNPSSIAVSILYPHCSSLMDILYSDEQL